MSYKDLLDIQTKSDPVEETVKEIFNEADFVDLPIIHRLVKQKLLETVKSVGATNWLLLRDKRAALQVTKEVLIRDLIELKNDKRRYRNYLEGRFNSKT